jgi:hypothetical protein
MRRLRALGLSTVVLSVAGCSSTTVDNAVTGVLYGTLVVTDAIHSIGEPPPPKCPPTPIPALPPAIRTSSVVIDSMEALDVLAQQRPSSHPIGLDMEAVFYDLAFFRFDAIELEDSEQMRPFGTSPRPDYFALLDATYLKATIKDDGDPACALFTAYTELYKHRDGRQNLVDGKCFALEKVERPGSAYRLTATRYVPTRDGLASDVSMAVWKTGDPLPYAQYSYNLPRPVACPDAAGYWAFARLVRSAHIDANPMATGIYAHRGAASLN